MVGLAVAPPLPCSLTRKEILSVGGGIATDRVEVQILGVLFSCESSHTIDDVIRLHHT